MFDPFTKNKNLLLPLLEKDLFGQIVLKMLLTGILISGIVTGVLTKLVRAVFSFGPAPETLPVYEFFLRIDHNRRIASWNEALYVEILDKTVSLIVASVVAFFICDLLHRRKRPHSHAQTSGR
ncbi:MAG TPA: hypothetical protein PLL75_01215 [Candidatus Omnitrophota bacterium]|nr:hypothetical protein [Candidatus Omnitrophota bacterium]HPS36333.1 hypothetical protein [Candidatus Omnitrophota bacterium]